MSFGAPGYLLLLLLVPAVAAAAGLWHRWRVRARARFAATLRGPGAAAMYAGTALAIAALAVAAFAAARPQAGSHTAAARDRGVDLVIVLDVSQSMLATDAEPTRLGRAQSEVEALLDRLQGDRAGLVIFARRPFVRSPLTPDLRALRNLVEGVDRERGLVDAGSDLGAAIAGGQRLLASGEARTKVMLIVSDGEDRGADVAPAVANARRAGTRVYAAGVGTAQGAPVRDIDPVTQQPRDRVDASGAPVITRLDAAALTSIAAAGGGRYIDLSGDESLGGLAAELRGLAQTDFGPAPGAQPIEWFQAFAALALLLAAGGLVLPHVLAPGDMARRLRRLLPLAGAGLLVAAVCSGGAVALNRRGNQAYDRGDFDAALAWYRTAQAVEPARGELYHNAGNAYDREGDYERAIEETQRALQPGAHANVQAAAEYALGNHYVGAGRLEDAREAYKLALLADPADADAKYNLEIVESLLRSTATPVATPTPPGGSPADATPGAGTGAATPAPGAGSDGTPAAGDSGQSGEQDPRRQLDDALAGIGQDVSEEEALRILDLLDRANRAENERQRLPGAAAPPDY